MPCSVVVARWRWRPSCTTSAIATCRTSYPTCCSSYARCLVPCSAARRCWTRRRRTPSFTTSVWRAWRCRYRRTRRIYAGCSVRRQRPQTVRLQKKSRFFLIYNFRFYLIAGFFCIIVVFSRIFADNNSNFKQGLYCCTNPYKSRS